MERKIYISLSLTASITAIITSFLVSFTVFEGTSYLDNFMSILPITVGVLVIVLIFLNMLSNYIARRIMEPIDQLNLKLDNFLARDSKEEIYYYKELEPLVSTLDKQAYEIENYIKKLEEAEAYRETLTANITHELKTPLTSINGFAELMASGQVDPLDSQKFASIILREGQKLLDMINSILSLSSLENDETDFELINVKEVFLEVYPNLKVIADQKKIGLNFQAEDLIILGNRSMIKEVFNNLVHNALNYNKESGQVYVRIEKEGGNCLISVRDTGIGIDPQEQKNIFKRFYTGEESRDKSTSGTGLGLAIVKHIVLTHQGQIFLESKLGQGSEFKILLPLK